jgi:hypothetical protein
MLMVANEKLCISFRQYVESVAVGGGRRGGVGFDYHVRVVTLGPA